MNEIGQSQLHHDRFFISEKLDVMIVEDLVPVHAEASFAQLRRASLLDQVCTTAVELEEGHRESNGENGEGEVGCTNGLSLHPASSRAFVQGSRRRPEHFIESTVLGIARTSRKPIHNALGIRDVCVGQPKNVAAFIVRDAFAEVQPPRPHHLCFQAAEFNHFNHCRIFHLSNEVVASASRVAQRRERGAVFNLS